MEFSQPEKSLHFRCFIYVVTVLNMIFFCKKCVETSFHVLHLRMKISLDAVFRSEFIALSVQYAYSESKDWQSVDLSQVYTSFCVGPVQNRTFWEFSPQTGAFCINMG